MELLRTIGKTERFSQILAAHPFLNGLAPRYLQFVADCAQEVRFEAGAYLLHQGAEANEFYLIQEGVVALGTQRVREGFTTTQTVTQGEVVGWSWLMPPHHWHMHAKAITPIRAIALDGKKLRERSELDHDFGYELFKRLGLVIGDRLRAARRRLGP